MLSGDNKNEALMVRRGQSHIIVSSFENQKKKTFARLADRFRYEGGLNDDDDQYAKAIDAEEKSRSCWYWVSCGCICQEDEYYKICQKIFYIADKNDTVCTDEFYSNYFMKFSEKQFMDLMG